MKKTDPRYESTMVRIDILMGQLDLQGKMLLLRLIGNKSLPHLRRLLKEAVDKEVKGDRQA